MGTPDKPTFERIVAEHGPFVRRTLSQLGVASRDLADVEQEVFRGVSKRLAAFDPTLASEPQNAVRSWLFGICERQAASHRRAATRRSEVLLATEDLDANIARGPNNEEKLDEAERKAILAELLATLEPRRRAVVVAYELEEAEMTEVAAALQIPVNTAWNRLRLAREDLRAAWRRLAAQRKKTRLGVMLPPLALLFGKPLGAGGDPLSWANDIPSIEGGLSPKGAVRRGLRDASRKGMQAVLEIKLVAALATGGLIGAGVHAAFTSPAPVPVRPSPTLAAAPASTYALFELPTADSASAGTPGDGLACTVPAGARAAAVPPPDEPVALARAHAAPSPALSASPRAAASAATGDVALQQEFADVKAASDAFEAGKVGEAERLLETYLRAHPDGRLQKDYQMLKVRSLLYYGRRHEALDRARALVASHPETRDSLQNLFGTLD